MLMRTQAQRKVYPKCSITQLPDQMLMSIFRRLPRYAILPATEVCSRWNSVISGSELLDSFTLRIDLSLVDENSIKAYAYFLSRSNRSYRKLQVVIRDHRSFVVAVMALRKFGRNVTDLSLTLDHRCVYPSFMQLHFTRMKDIEMGLEEHQQMLWEQEIESYDRCLLLIAVPKEKLKRQSNLWQEEAKYRRIEEIFLAFMYRQCLQLERLRIKRVNNYKDTRTKTLRYVGVEMERLQEMEINGTGLIVLSDAFLLKKLTVQGVTSGRPFYAGFPHAFPLLTHLEISDDMQFDNLCLWEISKRCANLEDLIFASDRITREGFCFIHRLTKLRKLSITLTGKHPDCRFEGCGALPVENLFVCSNELRMETIQATLMQNENMKEFVIRTRRCIEYSMLYRLQHIRPTCRLTYTLITV
ncbi:uncharacterized protein LOC110674230 [Aedes aegypti]|uniref:Uncharacterized protein n=1 Tax=Aedes aegypti TaxID=7159 RepID=A0A6I8U972_AEDAE|nr:uncharacterized protein LOC110674230 [Aedes aegypti]